MTVSFQIMFVPGTLYAIKTVGGSNIRRAVINGSILTGLGTVIRWYASQSFKDKNNDAMDHATATCTSNYLLILLGMKASSFSCCYSLSLIDGHNDYHTYTNLCFSAFIRSYIRLFFISSSASHYIVLKLSLISFRNIDCRLCTTNFPEFAYISGISVVSSEPT